PHPVQRSAPGANVGIERRPTFTTEPLEWVTNFASNYLPYVDFYEEDFPWRYTPNRPDDVLQRLRPWIALVVLEEGEFKDSPNIKNNQLPSIMLDDAADKFPPPEQLWAWAHVHVNRDLAASDTEIVSTDMNGVLPRPDNAIKSDADLAYARLMSPRKLKPNAAYHARLIPSFETCRRAALGLAADTDFAS